MRLRWEINERGSFNAFRRDKNLRVFTGQFSMLKHEINCGTCLTVESRLAWAKKSVNRVYFRRIHFEMGASDAIENIFFFVFNGLNFPSRCQDVNR